ncbi:MAG TPA: TIGR00730 family Rossman fold protein [Terriglobia bacterium]|nr:TIGR00730 family Rossman fold protein [Terriglobia bacterium]
MAIGKHETEKKPLVAYQDHQFVESSDARVLRILSEYLEPQARLRRARIQHTVVLFGSARIQPREVALQSLQELESKGKEGAADVLATAVKKARVDLEMSQYYEDARELSRLVTAWALSLQHDSRFLVVCSGGGPGIMEAANRGASEAGGKSIGLNIMLPTEQQPNPYITPELSFLFRYFFMRKLWFAQPARALIAFPGGFGTLDELFEMLTLLQTNKMGHRVTIVLYGSNYWKRAVNFEYFLEAGTISEEDLKLIRFADMPQQAFAIIKEDLTRILHVRSVLRHPFI